ncbi:Fe(2+)-dependent formamide hydrolase involved in riboflavin and F420 biosynthesis ArfB [Methanonatronarchaeum thermophilum]|uniref:Fe(2+)-dependent formamide hydrolase involved in riboflavin and F420 biosynthesis ArfB n=1 Tax=Methanonatronarchaeum thermophilum TaxID=1927129 RepID=A0A1Y3GCA1_9EURY|nr:creatininase family protein [Methanonatronarchaeum thermophilum]OUJ19082.1 Fe(2+)-dependent formamide hydrolase involved in riboflavin and F420 biosynthesis ArfB [Methanonatronarchaeum thermophilum]
METQRKVKIEEMTTQEIEKAIKNGIETALIMVGSTEQHGPHLPTSTDALIGEILGEKIAQKTNALMAPTIQVGCSDHHMDFKGTITIKPQTLMNLITDYCTSLSKQGFKNIAIISTHGGNCAPVTTIAPEISKKLDKTKIIPLSSFEKHIQIWTEATKNHGIKPGEINHAGAAETSILLAEYPELIDKQKIKKGYTGEINSSSIFTQGLKSYTKTGVLGNPEKATKKIGKKIIKDSVEYFSKEIKKQT